MPETEVTENLIRELVELMGTFVKEYKGQPRHNWQYELGQNIHKMLEHVYSLDDLLQMEILQKLVLQLYFKKHGYSAQAENNFMSIIHRGFEAERGGSDPKA